MALKKPCPTPGCPALVTRGHCPKHRASTDRLRGNAQERGYGAAWQKYRRAFLSLYPLCGMRPTSARPAREWSECKRDGIVTPARVVDHIVRHKGAADPLFWQESNHQALCTRCHDRKTASEK